MKKWIVSLAMCFMFLGIGSGFAEPLQMHTWKVGVEMSHITYEEPDVMEEKGFMNGIGGSYTYHNYIMLKAEGRFSYGQVDYKNSGTLDDIDDYMLEFRMLEGYDFHILNRSIVTPYIGIGYRYLNDDSSGRVSSTGHAGYERESNYYYSPVGIETLTELNKGWFIGVILEYDYFWKGKQKSNLGSIPGYYDIENHQIDGYGWRGSIKLQKEHLKRIFTIEPFARYWNIEDSTITIDPEGYIWYEPKNNSTEFGVNVSVAF
jgi:hypothetical protein